MSAPTPDFLSSSFVFIEILALFPRVFDVTNAVNAQRCNTPNPSSSEEGSPEIPLLG
jgi:hypothetical protein